MTTLDAPLTAPQSPARLTRLITVGAGRDGRARRYHAMNAIEPGTLGWELREARVAKHLTQAELAARAGVRQAQISAYERGEVKSPDPQTLSNLERVLGLPAGHLLAIAGWGEARHGIAALPPGSQVQVTAMLAATERFPLLERLFCLVQDLLGDNDAADQVEQCLRDISMDRWSAIVEQVETIQNHGAG